MIADVKSKITITSALFCRRDSLCHLKREVQNYQSKTGEKSLYPSKYMLTTYFKKFQRFKYISFILSLANCKQLRMSLLIAAVCHVFFNRYQIQSVQSLFDHITHMTQPQFQDIASYRIEIVCRKSEYQLTFSLFLSIPALVICSINNTIRKLIFLLSLPH